MCGIAGFATIGRNLAPDDQQALRRMTKAIAHRGPDAEGFFISDQVALGHRRLSVIDPHTGGQPMRSERTGSVIVFNGEIYNFNELNADLVCHGWTAGTKSDTETLLLADGAWGESCLSRLRGMFAFVIFDDQKRRLWGARDPYGKKPLYYYWHDGLFCFASEPKAILAHGAIRADLDHEALNHYLLYDCVPAPLSIYNNIRKLPAGQAFSLDLDNGTLKFHEYWDPAAIVPAPDWAGQRSHAEWLDGLGGQIRTAVQRRLIADVPLGIFLSGGIDSSVIAAAAVEIVGRDRVKTFNLGFDNPEYDESDRAARVAQILGTHHHQQRASEADILDLIPKIAGFLDEPLADPSILPTYLLAEFTRQSVTVALGGDGGDELFAGYDTFAALRPALWYNHLVPYPIHRGLISPLVKRLPASFRRFPWEFKAKRFIRGLKYHDHERLFRWIGAFVPDEVDHLLVDAYSGRSGTDRYEMSHGLGQRVSKWPPLQRDLYHFTKLYLGEGVLTKLDRATMACSLEARCPLLDIDLASFLAAMPMKIRFPQGPSKGLLRQTLARWVGPEIAKLPKRGFGIPIGPWLRGKLKPLLCDMLAPQRIRRAGIFQADYVSRLVDEHLTGRHDHRKPLWNLLMFELWRECWLNPHR